MDPIDCRTCKHYHITWDKHFPYGCKAMGFKSSTLPAREVFLSSGTRCEFFERKGTGARAKGFAAEEAVKEPE